MLKLGRVTKVKVLFLVLVFVFNFSFSDVFEFSAAILENGLLKFAGTLGKWILNVLFSCLVYAIRIKTN